MMRILHLIPSLSGGGAERQLSYLAPEMARVGHDVHVAYLYDGPQPPSWRGDNLTLHRIAARHNHDPGILLQILQLIHRLQPDLLQTWLLQMDILGGLAAQLSGIPWALHEPTAAAAWKHPTVKIRLRHRLGTHAGAVIANSAAGYAHWQALKVKTPCYTVHNALPHAEIAQVIPINRATAGIHPQASILLFVGRFIREKNIMQMLTALSRIVSQRQAVAVLLGLGPLRQQAIDFARAHQLGDRMRFPGFSNEVWAWMKAADVFVSVSEWEGRPNTVMEAMACNCPLVVSDIPQHREFLDDQLALLVNQRDPERIIDAILQTLDEPLAASRRAEKAYQSVAALDIPPVTESWLRIYQAVCSRMVNFTDNDAPLHDPTYQVRKG